MNVDRIYDSTERHYKVFAQAVAERVSVMNERENARKGSS